jgi:catechol 2,3-dioxygenase-like lactoylglutathione lyase family enzyme
MSLPGPAKTAPKAKPVIKPAEFHHVGIKTRRPEEMIAFYQKLLGVEEVVSLPFAVFLAYDEEMANHRLVLFTGDQFEGESDPKRIGLQHLAYQYAGIDELLEHYQALKASGIEPRWVTDHGPTMSFYYADPDGNIVELQIDNFGDTAGSLAFMRGPEFLANPLGTDVDPAKLIAARQAGAERDGLHRRAYAGEFVPDGGPVGPAAIGIM